MKKNQIVFSFSVFAWTCVSACIMWEKKAKGPRKQLLQELSNAPNPEQSLVPYPRWGLLFPAGLPKPTVFSSTQPILIYNFFYFPTCKLLYAEVVVQSWISVTQHPPQTEGWWKGGCCVMGVQNRTSRDNKQHFPQPVTQQMLHYKLQPDGACVTRPL